jgi:hypothetical protein
LEYQVAVFVVLKAKHWGLTQLVFDLEMQLDLEVVSMVDL